MSSFNAPAYDIERPTGQCAFTGRVFEEGEGYMATLVDVEQAADVSPGSATAAGLGLKRLDVSMEAWQSGRRPDGVFGYWKTTVSPAGEKKKLFVDDDVLMNLLHRLADTDQPQRLAFRFVLGLILMRKRLLKYDGSVQRPSEEGPQEWWLMIPKGQTEAMELLNPRLDEQQVQQVTEQLSEILEAEL